MAKNLAVVRGLERRFKGFTLSHIPRSENYEADELAKVAANNLPIPLETFYQVLKSFAMESLPKAFRMVLLTEGKDWIQAIIDSLNNKTSTASVQEGSGPTIAKMHISR